MKNLSYHCELVFGSYVYVGLNEYTSDDPDADTYYVVYQMLDNERIFYCVYVDLSTAKAVFNKLKYEPVTGPKE